MIGLIQKIHPAAAAGRGSEYGQGFGIATPAGNAPAPGAQGAFGQPLTAPAGNSERGKGFGVP